MVHKLIQRGYQRNPFLPIPQITKILDYHWLKYDNTKPNMIYYASSTLF